MLGRTSVLVFLLLIRIFGLQIATNCNPTCAPTTGQAQRAALQQVQLEQAEEQLILSQLKGNEA